MKKILGIIVLGLLLSGNTYAENLGTSKTVNDYVNDGYIIISVAAMDELTMAYTLRSNGKSKPLVVTCIYSPQKTITICFKP